MSTRYEARRSSASGEYAVVDTVTREVVNVTGVTSYAGRAALALSEQLNAMEDRFQESDHSPEAFRNLWESTVNKT